MSNFLGNISLLINDRKSKNLAIALTGSTEELEYYRSLFDDEKEKYNEKNL